MFLFGRNTTGKNNDEGDEYLSRVALGDESAFAGFYDLVIGRVYGVVRSVVRDPARSEEVSQEVMIEVWRTATRFTPSRGSAIGWTLTMAHRRAVDCVRTEEASRRRDRQFTSAQPSSAVDDPAALTANSLEAQRVKRALSTLTDAQRESVELAYFRGYTHNEVAATLDLPLGTVKTRIRDGLIRLRDQLGVNT